MKDRNGKLISQDDRCIVYGNKLGLVTNVTDDSVEVLMLSDDAQTCNEYKINTPEDIEVK